MKNIIKLSGTYTVYCNDEVKIDVTIKKSNMPNTMYSAVIVFDGSRNERSNITEADLYRFLDVFNVFELTDDVFDMIEAHETESEIKHKIDKIIKEHEMALYQLSQSKTKQDVYIADIRITGLERNLQRLNKRLKEKEK